MARAVILVHRRDQLRAEKVLQDRLFRSAKVDIVWDSVLDEVLGQDQPRAVTGVRLRNTRTGVLSERALEGVFIAIGHDPATQLVKGQLEMDRDGYVVTAPDRTATSVPGVFAAGDVQDKIYRQAVTAAGSGCMAALEAEKFLAELEADAPVMASYGAAG
jgi:thioredoxin reductase (NADPH)